MAEILKLNPGDRVLMTFPEATRQNDAERCVEILRERFPDIEITCLVGAQQILIQDG